MSEIKALVEAVAKMKLDDVRTAWRERFGEPPPLRSTDLMRRALADRLQLEGSSHPLDKRLAQLAARHRTGSKPTVVAHSFKTGSLLQREWQGERHQVEVVDGGYVWKGQSYKSLSAIARDITGARWNGPRFFGLREG
ncbi:DUF2924 domain-containing protein [Brevundimonas terrae]|uniref:DUF2924 domain-containing protein n=1 Tax=Brevundimonas terrae TaxID=363631 RepID=A0ABN0YL67_9CAUL|nr:DUF2924 domain-containing protein [Brevundimonas terrae]NIJ27309.1 hypothetical protein [Brevundimonas terrae]